MSPAAEIALVASREVKKNLRSAKGLILLGLSIVGGTAIALLMTKFITHKLSGMTEDQIHQAQEQLFAQMADDPAVGKYMATAPLPLVQVLSMSIWLAPLLIALAGFDAVSGELQHRSVRYWVVRTRRASYYVGKLLGVWLTVSAITLGMNVAMWIVSLGGAYSAGSTLTWGVGFWLMTLPISAVWCGLATLVASLFRQPVLSLLLTFASFFVVWLFGFAVSHAADVHWLSYVYPNNYDAWLMSPHPERVAGAVGICLAATALFTTVGAAFFARRDV